MESYCFLNWVVLKFYVTQNFCDGTQNRENLFHFVDHFVQNSALQSCFWLTKSNTFLFLRFFLCLASLSCSNTGTIQAINVVVVSGHQAQVLCTARTAKPTASCVQGMPPGGDAVGRAILLLLYTRRRGVTCHGSWGAHLSRVETRCTEREKKVCNCGERRKAIPRCKRRGTLAIPCPRCIPLDRISSPFIFGAIEKDLGYLGL